MLVHCAGQGVRRRGGGAGGCCGVALFALDLRSRHGSGREAVFDVESAFILWWR